MVDCCGGGAPAALGVGLHRLRLQESEWELVEGLDGTMWVGGGGATASSSSPAPMVAAKGETGPARAREGRCPFIGCQRGGGCFWAKKTSLGEDHLAGRRLTASSTVAAALSGIGVAWRASKWSRMHGERRRGQLGR